MAGPQLVGVRTVLDPFAPAQEALTNAVDIFRNREISDRENEKHEMLTREHKESQKHKDVLSTYDPALGVNGKGLTGTALEEYNTQTARAVAQFQSRIESGEDVPPAEDVIKGFNELGRELMTKEDAKKSIIADLRSRNIPLEKASSFAEIYTGGMRSQADIKAAEAARIEAMYKTQEARINSADKSISHQINAHKADRLTAAEIAYLGGNKKSTYSTGYSKNSGGKSTGLFNDMDLKKVEDVEAYLLNKVSPSVWGTLKTDANAASEVLRVGYSQYAQKAFEEGVEPLSFDDATMLMVSSINGPLDADVVYQDAGKFAAKLTSLGSTRAGAKGGTGGVPRGILEINQTDLNNLRDTQVFMPKSYDELSRSRVIKAFNNRFGMEPAAATPSTASNVLPNPPKEVGNKSAPGAKKTLAEAQKERDALAASLEAQRVRGETQDTEDVKDIENVKDVKGVKDIGNVKDVKDIGNVKDVKDIGNVKDVKDPYDYSPGTAGAVLKGLITEQFKLRDEVREASSWEGGRDPYVIRDKRQELTALDKKLAEARVVYNDDDLYSYTYNRVLAETRREKKKGESDKPFSFQRLQEEQKVRNDEEDRIQGIEDANLDAKRAEYFAEQRKRQEINRTLLRGRSDEARISERMKQLGALQRNRLDESSQKSMEEELARLKARLDNIRAYRASIGRSAETPARGRIFGAEQEVYRKLN